MNFTVQQTLFGSHADNEHILITVSNKLGIKFSVCDFGARLVEFATPDRNGNIANVVLGFANLEDYVNDKFYCGATIGRYAGRMEAAKFTLDNITYSLSDNHNGMTLHGGLNAMSNQKWQSRIIELPEKVGVIFSLISPHLENGFPGNLVVEASYWLTQTGKLRIEYSAISDQQTIINLTNHSYFNLLGNGTNILSHHLEIVANQYIEVTPDLLATGAILDLPVELSFAQSREINEVVEAFGYQDLDLSYILEHSDLDHENSVKVNLSALEVGKGLCFTTNQNTAQIFTSKRLNQISSTPLTEEFGGIAIEMQNYLAAIHHSNFPTTILKPNEKYLNWLEISPYIFN